MTRAVSLAREWLNAQEPKLPPKPKRTLCPNPRPPHCIVLNTDASWKASSMLAGFGWTIRDSAGTSSFTRHERFVGSALVAEGLVLREALTRCNERGVRKVVCESDSTQLI